MAIQKVSAIIGVKQNVSSTKIKKSDVSSPSHDNVASEKSSQAIKNSFMSGISFKGFSKQQSKTDYSINATSGALVSISASDISRPKYTNVSKGEKGYDTRVDNYASCSVYYADPGETITDDIRKNHSFIVEYDKKPRAISKDEIDSSEKASELMGIVDALKITVAILEAEYSVSSSKLDDVDLELEQMRKQYEALKALKDERSAQRSNIEIELTENRDKLEIAQTKYKTLKEKEEAEYRAAERRRKLAEIQKQIELVNEDAEEKIRQIVQMKNDQLGELERMKQEILEDDE